MNWNGGTLHAARKKAKANKAAQRQKQYFASAQAGRRFKSGDVTRFVPSHLKEKSPYKPSDDKKLSPSAAEGGRRHGGSHQQTRLDEFSMTAPVVRRLDSMRERPSPPTRPLKQLKVTNQMMMHRGDDFDRKRLQLLAKPDWAGLTTATVAKYDFSRNGRKRDLGKRSTPHSKTRQQQAYSIGPPRLASGEDENILNIVPGSDLGSQTRICFGQDALLSTSQLLARSPSRNIDGYAGEKPRQDVSSDLMLLDNEFSSYDSPENSRQLEVHVCPTSEKSNSDATAGQVASSSPAAMRRRRAIEYHNNVDSALSKHAEHDFESIQATSGSLKDRLKNQTAQEWECRVQEDMAWRKFVDLHPLSSSPSAAAFLSRSKEESSGMNMIEQNSLSCGQSQIFATPRQIHKYSRGDHELPARGFRGHKLEEAFSNITQDGSFRKTVSSVTDGLGRDSDPAQVYEATGTSKNALPSPLFVESSSDPLSRNSPRFTIRSRRLAGTGKTQSVHEQRSLVKLEEDLDDLDDDAASLLVNVNMSRRTKPHARDRWYDLAGRH